MAELVQGGVYWLEDDEPFGSEPGFRRPWIVVQNNAMNATRWGTALACPFSTNLRLAGVAGNLLVRRGEGGLPQASVLLVSGLASRDRTLFGDQLGEVSIGRVAQMIRAIWSLLEPREP